MAEAEMRRFIDALHAVAAGHQPAEREKKAHGVPLYKLLDAPKFEPNNREEE